MRKSTNIPAKSKDLAEELAPHAKKLKTEGAGGFNPLNNATGINRASAPEGRFPPNSSISPSFSANRISSDIRPGIARSSRPGIADSGCSFERQRRGAIPAQPIGLGNEGQMTRNRAESPAYRVPKMPPPPRAIAPRGLAAFISFAFVCCFALPAIAQQDAPAPAVNAPKSQQRVLDHVIAVVNNQVILASDLELEQRFARLLPIDNRIVLDPKEALERLTTRALIEQQILQEDPHGLEIRPAELQDSLAELRKNLPGCRHRDCSSDAGWKTYLATLDLTPERVSEYWSRRMAVLRFIEQRFRSGIRIAPEEIEKYYRETLVPRYAKPEDAPKLEQLSPRIQEILLQQQVNALLSDWLKSLQDQGQVEILDPALRPAPVTPASGAHSLNTRPSSTGEPPGKEAGIERS